MLDPFTIKPLDRKLILDSARATKGRILTVEDHYYEGEGPRQRARAAGAGGEMLATGNIGENSQLLESLHGGPALGGVPSHC